MSEAEAGSASVREYRENLGHAWLDVRAWLQDRRRILAQPQAMLETPSPLAFRPLRFMALLSLVLPTTLVTLLVTIATTITPAAPDFVDENLAMITDVRTELHAAFGAVTAAEPMRTPQRDKLYEPLFPVLIKFAMTVEPTTRAEVRREFADQIARLRALPLDDDVRAVVGRLDRNLANRQRMERFRGRLRDSGAHDALYFALGGLTVLLNGAFFRALVRRRRDLFPHADAADRVLLFYLPARGFFIYLALLGVALLAHWATLYAHHELLQVAGALYIGFGLFTIGHALLRCAPVMTAVLAGDAAPSAAARRSIALRLLACFMLTQLALFFVGAVIGFGTSFVGSRVG